MCSSYSSLLKVSTLNHEILIFSCSHLIFSYYESSLFLCALFVESIEGNHFLLAHIPRMNESHDPGRPFKVVITISYSSSIVSTCGEPPAINNENEKILEQKDILLITGHFEGGTSFEQAQYKITLRCFQ